MEEVGALSLPTWRFWGLGRRLCDRNKCKRTGFHARKKIDSLVDFVKGYGLKGLAYLSVQEDGSFKSSFAKFMTPEELESLAAEGRASLVLMGIEPDCPVKSMDIYPKGKRAGGPGADL